MRNRAATTAAVMVMLTLLGGCAESNGGPSVDARAPLEKRRSYAEARDDSLALLTELRTTMSGVVPGLQWLTPKPEVDGESGCAEPEFEGVEGASHATFDSGGAKGAISDGEWPAVWTAVQEVAGRQGFARPKVLKDEPGHHVVSLYDDDGAELSINTKVNTAMSIYGACHLRT